MASTAEATLVAFILLKVSVDDLIDAWGVYLLFGAHMGAFNR